MKNKILLLLSAVLMLTACDGFLDLSPKHKWDMESAISSYSSAQQAVNGIYGATLLGDDLNASLNTAYCSRSGLVKTNQNEYDFAYTQSNSPSGLWQKCYIGVNACNLAISQIPLVSDSSFPTATAKEELIAEARFLRGYFNSILMINYCHWWEKNVESPYGIIYRSEMTTPDNAYQPRISVGDSWIKIFDDIDYGIEKMSDTFVSNRKVSKIFAKAWKAKLLMIRGWNGDYSTAATLVDQCIAALPAAGISMQADMAKHFEESWDSKENIFVRYLNDDGKRTSNAGYWTEYGPAYNLGDDCVIASSGVETLQSEVACGMRYGVDWMHTDPRWYISTGKARNPETWDNTESWTWTKIYRKGRVAGQQDPVDEKYATYYMRVPELYIMKAELLAHSGASYKDAIAPINEMRAKRTNPVLDPLPTPANEQEMWDFIFQEYVKELILENGCEYWASLRIKKDGVTYMEHIKGADYTHNQTKLQYPIPNDEMINNPQVEGMQNPDQE